MPIIIPANSAVAGGFSVDNSCRFDGSSSKLVKSQSAGNRQRWTYSVWLKRCAITSTTTTFFASSGGGNVYSYLGIQSDKIRWLDYDSSNNSNLITTAVFRDPSAWYHVVFAFNSNLGSGETDKEERTKLYINGVRVTSFGTAAYAGHNQDSGVNVNSANFILSSNQDQSSGSMWNGYMAEAHFIDGTAYQADSFGEFDSDSGVWKPIEVSGLTYGTNGYYLDFKDSANLGNDANGGTDFTESGLAATDQTQDTCTNNFATINPLDNFYANAVFAEGNTKITTNSSAEAMNTGTIALSGGRWYYEIDIIDRGSTAQVGFTPHGSRVLSGVSGKAGDVTPFTQAYMNTGKVQTGNGSGGQTDLATLSSYTTGNIIGVYLDLVDFKSYWSKDGVLQNSGTGLNITALNANSHGVGGGTGVYIPYVGDNSSGTPAVFELNFGNPFQSQSSSVTDDNGFGKFEYSPNITGDGTAKSFFAICTKNLASTGGE